MNGGSESKRRVKKEREIFKEKFESSKFMVKKLLMLFEGKLTKIGPLLKSLRNDYKHSKLAIF